MNGMFQRFIEWLSGGCCSKSSHDYLIQLLQSSGRSPTMQVAQLHAEGIHIHTCEGVLVCVLHRSIFWLLDYLTAAVADTNVIAAHYRS